MNTFNIGDIVYIIKYHKEDNKIVHHIERCRICNYSDWHKLYYVKFKDINKSDLDKTTCGLNTYKEHRLFSTYKEARKELDLKNREAILKEEYNKAIKELRK